MSLRATLSAASVLLLCAVWSVPIERPSLYVLREVYRLGEYTGITRAHPAPGSRLAGQILGFNYSQPPGWYELFARCLAATVCLAVLLLPALWMHRFAVSRGRPVRSAPWSLLRAPLAAVTAGIVFALLDMHAGYWLWSRFLGLGELLGGSATRISGQVAIGARGPFFGSSAADNLGNLLVRFGPHVVCTVIAAAAGLVVYSALWSRDLRRAAKAGHCGRCGYDLRSTPGADRCPECGGECGGGREESGAGSAALPSPSH